MKLSPKCNLGFFFFSFFFCECICVKPSCKSIITMKEALWRFTLLSFSAQTRFQWECMGHFYASIKNAIFKTLRRLGTTWNFARSITSVSTHRSAEPHTLYPDVLIPEYVWAAMTWLEEEATANVSCSKMFFLVNNVLNVVTITSHNVVEPSF